MLRRFLPAALILVTLLLPKPARAFEGFLFGLDFGYGSWGINTSKFKYTDPTVGYSPGDVQAFAQTTSNGNFDINMHLGWNFFGHASLEAVIQGTSWNTFNTERGGAGFGGGRVTWYPLQIFSRLNDRRYDVGLEFGAGYTISGGPSTDGGPTLGMDGYYLAPGIVAEWRVSRTVGFTLGFRYFIANWSKFYLNYNDGIYTPASGVQAGWATVTLGILLHVPSS